jgi:hypothetical protein
MLARQVREPATLKASREPTVVDCKKAAVDSNGQSAEGGTPKIERVERQRDGQAGKRTSG